MSKELLLELSVIGWILCMVGIWVRGDVLKYQAQAARLKLLEEIVRLRGKRAGRRPGKLPFCTCTMTWGADGAKHSALGCRGIHRGQYSGNQRGTW